MARTISDERLAAGRGKTRGDTALERLVSQGVLLESGLDGVGFAVCARSAQNSPSTSSPPGLALVEGVVCGDQAEVKVGQRP